MILLRSEVGVSVKLTPPQGTCECEKAYPPCHHVIPERANPMENGGIVVSSSYLEISGGECSHEGMVS